MATASNTAPKKSNTCLIVVIVLVVLGFMLMVGGFLFLKFVPSLILKNLTASTQNIPTQTPLQKIVGSLTGGLIGGNSGTTGEGASLNPRGGEVPSEALSLQRCTPGESAFATGWVGAGYAYTGKEKFNLGGQNIELCCMAVFDVTQGQTLANAEDRMCGDGNDTMVYTHKVDGKFVPYLAGYKKNGEDCTVSYDESGNIVTNYCGQ